MENPSSPVEWCAYAAVCRVPLPARANVPVRLQRASDLLVAIAHQQLHVFTRRGDRLPSACGCHAAPESDGACSGLLAKHGFVCPHVTNYDDVTHALSIPVHALAQVYMTYRTTTSAATPTATGSMGPTTTATTGKGVATRTKDLVVRTSSGVVLWLEFEHNLARGWFLEALTTASSPPSSFEVDYLDLGDAAAVASATTPNGTTGPTAPPFQAMVLQAPSPTAFLRDAWRHVVYEKIKLALQVAHDSPTTSEDSDPTVACLLTTAMELSTRLDEPDLNAFTWLTSGFLNLRTSNVPKQALAHAQVLHALDLAQQHSLEYLTCLALQCAASASLPLSETPQAREWLTHATKLLTQSARCAAMEPALKMQLHATLHGLSEKRRPSVQRAHSVLGGGGGGREGREGGSVSALLAKKLQVARSDSSSSLLGKERKPATFSLWAHVFGGASRRCRGGGDAVKRLLLERVEKTEDNGRGSSVLVDVLGAHGVHKVRLRVFYDTKATVAWLSDHITARYQAVVAVVADDAHGDPVDEVPRIELFYDPQRKQLVPSHVPLREWLGDGGAVSEPTLHAKLAPRIVSSHRTVLSSPFKIPVALEEKIMDAPEYPSMLCSLCGTRIPLGDVEDHSESCF